MNALYNPMVGANIISSACALDYFEDEPLAPTGTSVRTPNGEILEGVGILRSVPIKYEGIELVLDFHIFDIHNFDLVIGLPLEKFLVEAWTQGRLDICLG